MWTSLAIQGRPPKETAKNVLRPKTRTVIEVVETFDKFTVPQHGVTTTGIVVFSVLLHFVYDSGSQNSQIPVLSVAVLNFAKTD